MQSRPCDSSSSTGKVNSGDKWCKCFIKLLHPPPTPPERVTVRKRSCLVFKKMSCVSYGCILLQNEFQCCACECKVTGAPEIEVRGRDVLTCTHVCASPSSTIRSAHLSITLRISVGFMSGRVMSDQGWKHMTLLTNKQENNTFG